jgi:DNA repair photolyase
MDLPDMESPSTDRLIGQVLDSPNFSIGPSGTLISLGCLSETLSPASIEHTLNLLYRWPRTRNPIQLATRWSLRGEHLDNLLINAVELGIVLCHSFSTLKRSRDLEPGTPSLERRLSFMEKCSAAGVRSMLYLKPMIPRVTFEDREEFTALAHKLAIKTVVVGPLFTDRRIAALLSQVLEPSWESSSFRLETMPVLEELGEERMNGEGEALTEYFRAEGFSVYNHSDIAVRVMTGQ